MACETSWPQSHTANNSMSGVQMSSFPFIQYVRGYNHLELAKTESSLPFFLLLCLSLSTRTTVKPSGSTKQSGIFPFSHVSVKALSQYSCWPCTRTDSLSVSLRTGTVRLNQKFLLLRAQSNTKTQETKYISY